jgi:micrococcal nuclease
MRKVRRIATAIVILAVFAAGWFARGCALQMQTEAEYRRATAEDPPPEGFVAECTRVIDGDTIELSDGEHVRYIGMDTPEMRPVEEYAEAATEANRELVEGKTVIVVPDVELRDRYGRLLAYIYVDDTFVNAELVRRGLAQVATYPPNVRYQGYFLKLQREAREAGRGLWSDTAAD